MKSRTRVLLGLAFTHALLGAIGYHYGIRQAGRPYHEFRPHAAQSITFTPTSAPVASPGSGGNLSSPPANPVETSTTPSSPELSGFRSRLAKLSLKIETMNAASVLNALNDLDPNSADPDHLITQQLLLSRFAELDPETALSFTDSLTPAEKTTGRLTVLNTWAENDPSAAADYFDSEADSFGILDPSQGKAAGIVAREWARNDPEAALNWAASLPEEVRGDAYRQIIGQIDAGPSGSEQAIEVLNHLEPGYERTELVETLAASWAKDTPQETADWVTQIQNQDERSRAASSLVSTWMKSNPEAATQWVNTLATGSDRDAAIVAMSESKPFRQNPLSAIQWAETIQDDRIREETLQAVINRWAAVDPERAHTWVQSQTSGR